jgi:hypothetical protein
MRKRTRSELEQAVREGDAYREAFWALMRGEKPIAVVSGELDASGEPASYEDGSPAGARAWLLGPFRASGGVVLLDAGGTSVRWALEWASDVQHLASVNPYLADVGRKVFRLCADAIKERVQNPVWRDATRMHAADAQPSGAPVTPRPVAPDWTPSAEGLDAHAEAYEKTIIGLGGPRG